MMRKQWPFGAVLMTCALLGAAALLSLGAPAGLSAQQAGGQDIFGPYEVVPNWPKPLPDTAHSHEGWTWGSTSGVYAESPDKVWVIQRGELPLPPGAKPWTPSLRSGGRASRKRRSSSNGFSLMRTSRPHNTTACRLYSPDVRP